MNTLITPVCVYNCIRSCLFQGSSKNKSHSIKKGKQNCSIKSIQTQATLKKISNKKHSKNLQRAKNQTNKTSKCMDPLIHFFNIGIHFLNILWSCTTHLQVRVKWRPQKYGLKWDWRRMVHKRCLELILGKIVPNWLLIAKQCFNITLL